MFSRILVLLENAKIDQDLCQAALKLAAETGARLKWVYLQKPQEPCDFEPLRFLRQQALSRYGIESDISQMAGELGNVVREQLIKWGPDLLMIDHTHLQKIASIVTNQHKCSQGGLACSVMTVANSAQSGALPAYPVSPSKSAIPTVPKMNAANAMIAA
jgi:hypothetical protein